MNTPTPKELKELRLDIGLTQREAADLVYVSEVVWRCWEAGRPPELGKEAFNNYKRATELFQYKINEGDK